MKIKEVCMKTGLTERTIRFYIEKALIQPASVEINGRVYYDYSKQDVENLGQIAFLRKIGLSIESVLAMKQNPECIDMVLNTHLSLIYEKEKDFSRIIKILERAKGMHFSNMNDLTRILNSDISDIPLPLADIEPNFAQFDSDTEEERENGYLDFLVHQRIREKMDAISRPVKKAGKIAAGIILALLIAYALSCIPKSISREYSGLQFRFSDAKAESTVNISIHGKLYNRLFHKPVFKGKIEIDSVDYTKDCPVELNFFHGIGKSAWLVYSEFVRNGNDVVPTNHSFALVWTDKSFSKAAFQLYEPVNENNGSYRDLVICAPASTVEEGTRVLEGIGLLDTLRQYAD